MPDKCETCGHPTASKQEIEKVLSSGKKPGVNRHYDIPYVAGYSKAGDVIFIDRHFPRYMDYIGKKIDTDPFLIEHEWDEERLIHKLGFHYLHAHHIALGRENKRATDAFGKGFMEAYEAHLKKYEKKCEDERITKVPKNLDLTPYSEEHDKNLQKLKDAMI